MQSADVVVIGGGLIGLAVTAGAAARGASVVLIGESRAGEASAAGAGMLAPGAESGELPGDAVLRFAIAGRDLFPLYLAALRDSTGVEVPLDRSGILELQPDGEPASPPLASEWLDARALRELEPALGDFPGALLYAGDGSVDNVVLLQALRRRVKSFATVRLVTSRARALDLAGGGARVTISNGDTIAGGRVVLASGAWAGQLDGLPSALPVRPMRGQMISLGGSPLRHVTYGAGGYLVPRTGGRTLVGATMESAGFDNATTAEGRASLSATASRIAPALASATLLSHWAGLRPLTPDHLPILGVDPRAPQLLYACGHGRNGILLAPLTGESIGALAVGEHPEHDLSPFALSRFDAAL